jgi:hypothetical protein
MKRNPFIAGKHVKGKDFINRNSELLLVLDRLVSGQSTTIVGEPHMGKTSFLLNLEDPKLQKKYVDSKISSKWVFSYISGLSFQSATPQKFWERALYPLSTSPGNKTISRLVAQAKKSHYDSWDIQLLCEALRNQNRMLVVLIDEFENFLMGENFQDPAFFGLLRDLSSVVGGIALVVSSRFGHSELNKLGVNIKNPGSPYLSHAVSVQLSPFDEIATNVLFQKAKSKFSQAEFYFIKRVAGGNPYLLQLLSSNMFMTAEINRIERVANQFHEQLELDSHFENLWSHLKDSERTVSVILSVMALEGRVLGSSFNYGEIERVDIFGIELRKLAQRGLAQKVESTSKGWIFDAKELLVWRGEKWALSCEAYAWWIRDTIISRSRSIPSYDEWLKNKKYAGLITQEQWSQIKNGVEKMPAWAINGVGGLAKILWEQICSSL